VTPSKRNASLAALAVVIAAGGLFRAMCGFYSIQPIGALPRGVTAVVRRSSSEPFFNSPDAQCLDRVGSVSLLCRGLALSQAPTERILLRLPFQRWAYLASTNGSEFDR